MSGRGMACALAGAVGFSFKAILVKLAYRYGVDAITLLALRMAFALPFFLAMGVVAERRASAPISRADGGRLIALGVFGYYLASYLDFVGLQFISAALERLILFLYPTLVILLAALFLGQPVRPRTLAALALCYAGIALAFVHDLNLGGERTAVLMGGAAVFASALSYALYLLGSGQVVTRLGATRVTAWATSVACLLCLGQFLVLRPLGALALPIEVYGLALAMALVSTVFPVWLLTEAIRLIGAGPVALAGTLGPVLTMLFGWLLLDETIGVGQSAGAVLVVGGVVLAARIGRPPPGTQGSFSDRAVPTGNLPQGATDET